MEASNRKLTCWKAKSFETERYIGRSDFPFPQCSRIEHAQLLAMDYPNMLTAVAVRNYIVNMQIELHNDILC